MKKRKEKRDEAEFIWRFRLVSCLLLYMVTLSTAVGRYAFIFVLSSSTSFCNAGPCRRRTIAFWQWCVTYPCFSRANGTHTIWSHQGALSALAIATIVTSIMVSVHVFQATRPPPPGRPPPPPPGGTIGPPPPPPGELFYVCVLLNTGTIFV